MNRHRPEAGDNINNVILKNSNEHKIILDYVAKYDQLLQAQDFGLLQRQMTATVEAMLRDLADHFAAEEKYFFPAALAGCANPADIVLVLQLQKEHGVLETELAWISEKLGRAGSQRNTEPARDFYRQVAGFLNRLKDHARLEIVSLFPLIDATPAMRKKFEELTAANARGP